MKIASEIMDFWEQLYSISDIEMTYRLLARELLLSESIENKIDGTKGRTWEIREPPQI